MGGNTKCTQNPFLIEKLVLLGSYQITSSIFCDFVTIFSHSLFFACLTMASTSNASASAERPSYQYGRPSAAAARSAIGDLKLEFAYKIDEKGATQRNADELSRFADIAADEALGIVTLDWIYSD